jgi:hypothetical protein
MLSADWQGMFVREARLFFQEFDIANCHSLPLAPTFERHVSWTKQTLSSTGARTQLGLELDGKVAARNAQEIAAARREKN